MLIREGFQLDFEPSGFVKIKIKDIPDTRSYIYHHLGQRDNITAIHEYPSTSSLVHFSYDIGEA